MHFNYITFQGGAHSLGLDKTAASYAVFGPYPDLCITAPHTCAEGFTIGLWIRRANECDKAASTIFSTRSLTGSTGAKEGITIRCDTNPSKLNIHLKVSSGTKSEPSPTFATANTIWFHCTVVWTVGTNLVIYENGQYLTTGGMFSTTGLYNNTDPLMVFGRRYTDGQLGADDYATGFVDGVKIYNRPLNATEVTDMYNALEDVYQKIKEFSMIKDQ